MARKSKGLSLRKSAPILIGAGITEQYYFKHLKDIKGFSLIIKPRLFGNEQIEAIERRINEIKTDNKHSLIIVVFDADVTLRNKKENERLKVLKQQYANDDKVLLCDSMPSIEYWFLLHYKKINRELSQKQAEDELRKHIKEYKKKEHFLKQSMWVDDMVTSGKLTLAMQRAEDFGNKGKSYSNIWKGIKELQSE